MKFTDKRGRKKGRDKKSSKEEIKIILTSFHLGGHFFQIFMCIKLIHAEFI